MGLFARKLTGLLAAFGFFWKIVNVCIETLSVNDQVVLIAILSNSHVQWMLCMLPSLKNIGPSYGTT